MTAGPAPSIEDAVPPFDVVHPATAGPFVFASPHSGAIYPRDMRPDPALSERSLRSAEDAFVDRLIASGAAHGASLILGRIGRAYVDLNRSPEDLDPALIDDLTVDIASPRVAAGYGVAPRLSGDGRALYHRRLSLDETRGRIARVHTPYHAALDELVAAARARHGRAILIDWHSMPARATARGKGVKGAADVVLGDRHGASASARMTRELKALFEALGWRVALNVPYAGGWTTQRCGHPREGVDAIQVELSRALYLDETTLRPGPGWDRCAAGVARVIAGLTATRP